MYISVLTLNVFPGSPIPYLYNGTRALFGSTRLESQMNSIATINPDIVCLQELYCTRVRDMYQRRFGSEYRILHETRSTMAGMVCARILELFLILFTMLITRYWPFIITGAYLLWCNSALFAWLSGDATGLTIMVRHKIGTVLSYRTQDFLSQSGDWMNVVSPRAFSVTEIETSIGLLSVFNAHFNALGSETERCQQVLQLANIVNTITHPVVICTDLNSTETSESAQLLKHTGRLYDVMDNQPNRVTWSTRNNLSRAWMQTADMCVDFIFVRDLRVTSARTVFTEPPFISDHFGVLAIIPY